MVLAASRLGSSIRTFLPSNHGSLYSAKGSKVLLPAPGGALTIKVFCALKNSHTCGMIAFTGRSICMGLKGTEIQFKVQGHKIKESFASHSATWSVGTCFTYPILGGILKAIFTPLGFE